jgi:octaprenyl-diphosphate synthase
MTPRIDAAVRALRETASAQAHDPRLATRLEDVQGLLGEHLVQVERALSQAAAGGRAPGSQAAGHLVGGGGKRIRPIALLLSARCYGPISDVARELAVVAELIHSATLLHDDVIDDGMERRGAPTARRIWGNAVSVLGGDLLLVDALERTANHAPEVLPSLLATLRKLVDGEITQLAGRRELDPSRDVYERILRGKTASLFAWATATGARIAGASTEDRERFGVFGELVGMAFQLVDDVLDYASEVTEKTRLGDLREGKLTLPLVVALERDPALLESVKRVHAGDDGPLDMIRERVLRSNACQDVRRLADDYTARAVAVLGETQAGDGRRVLEAVAEQLARRSR